MIYHDYCLPLDSFYLDLPKQKYNCYYKVSVKMTRKCLPGRTDLPA